MVVIIGSGVMGSGISASFLAVGQDVRLIDITADLLALARQQIESSLQRMAKHNPELVVTDLLERLSLATTHEQSDSTLIIEATPEDMALKQALLSETERVYSDEAIIATNTSSLSPTELATVLKHPERFIGMHFFNPVPMSLLVELVAAENTTEATVASAKDWVNLLGKTPILVNDQPGFASSRLGLALGLEAIRMLEAGVADAQDIDAVMRLGYKHPVGPLELTDLVGLDVRLAIAEHLELST